MRVTTISQRFLVPSPAGLIGDASVRQRLLEAPYWPDASLGNISALVVTRCWVPDMDATWKYWVMTPLSDMVQRRSWMVSLRLSHIYVPVFLVNLPEKVYFFLIWMLVDSESMRV